ncbi:MAG: hypothetical protein LAP61_05540 [Acidobacteriia bacterium]|nr:hypothetical protein [Terriglobia bacterium]
MRPIILIFTISVAIGYLIGWATDSKAVNAPKPRIEHLTLQPAKHGYLLAPHQTNDAIELAAYQVSCRAIRGCK